MQQVLSIASPKLHPHFSWWKFQGQPAQVQALGFDGKTFAGEGKACLVQFCPSNCPLIRTPGAILSWGRWPRVSWATTRKPDFKWGPGEVKLLASACICLKSWSWSFYQVQEKVGVWKCETWDRIENAKCWGEFWVTPAFIFQNENVLRADAIHSQLWITFHVLFYQDICNRI